MYTLMVCTICRQPRAADDIKMYTLVYLFLFLFLRILQAYIVDVYFFVAVKIVCPFIDSTLPLLKIVIILAFLIHYLPDDNNKEI